METFSERRSHSRLRCDLTSRARLLKQPCRLLDISLGGMAFSYPATIHLPQTADLLAKQLFNADELCLDAVDCHTISDFPLPLQDALPPLRRRGVQFARLSPAQEKMLQYVIWLHNQAAGPGNRRSVYHGP